MMQYCVEEFDFETALEQERPRLVRLCTWFTGGSEQAEDLAQETLIAAWKNRNRLTTPDKFKPWTSAIARNICLSWSRGRRHEQAHVLRSSEIPELFFEELRDETDLELELDRHELATLLDRALSRLPAETGQMLIEHYIQESSHAEIAARLKLKPGTVAVRLQRGKLILQKYMRRNMRQESFAFGWLSEEGTEWEETNIWCLCCGRTRLVGRLRKNQEFALRCPQCDPDAGTIMAGMDLSQPYYANLLGSIKTYKPAYSRLIAALAPLYRQALESGTSSCPACGQALTVRVESRMKTHSSQHETRQIQLHCPACTWASNKTISGLVMALPETQQFWREHPRVRILPDREIDHQGSPAFLTQIQSVTTGAKLHVVSKGDTFEPLEVWTNVPL